MATLHRQPLTRTWELALYLCAMHPYHHFFPGIAFSELPRVHAIYQRAGLIDERHVFHGYLAYLRYITRPTAGVGPAA